MRDSLRKLIRTIQSEFYFLKEAKDALNLHSRRLLSVPHETEFYALDLIPDELPGCYLDVGANQGQSIESIKLMKPQARVYSFEANPLLAEKLRARYQHRDEITIFPHGLSDEPQRLTLFVPIYKGFVYDGASSLDREQATILLSPARLYWFAPERLELKSVPCAVERLDDQNLDPLFMKIDVQGFEYHVVKGGLETIKRHEPILMIECVYDHPKMMSILDGLGYQEYLFNERGFYRGRSAIAVNQILMTPRRAREVYQAAPTADFPAGRPAPRNARIPLRVLARLRASSRAA